MTTQDVIDFYKGLLILQYASLPNALATIDAYISQLVQGQIADQVRNAFDVTTAIGAQLNILGTYRGINRTVFGVLPANDWSLVPYLDPAPNSYYGWADYTAVAPNPTQRWLQYNDLVGVPYQLTDSQMRKLIQLKAKLDSWDGSLAEMDNILYSFLGTYTTLIDNENMSITYRHLLSDPDPDNIYEMGVLANVFPHPSGVSVSFVEV